MALAIGPERSVVKIDKKTALQLIKQLPKEQLLTELSNEDPFIWIWKNVPTEHGSRLDFDRRPYLIDIIRDFSPHIAYKKSAQVGITQCGGIAKCLYAVDKIGITSIYTFPTARDVSDFSTARFRYIVRKSKYLSAKIGEVDNQGLVRVGNSVIYFRGTSSTKQALSVPSGLNIHDELDFSHPGVRETYSSRLDAAEFTYNGKQQYGWEWDFSTPTLPKFGISALYDISDKHEWWVRCSRCNRRQRVNFFKNMRKTHRGRRFFGCLKCDKELDRVNGVWVPRHPGAHIRGYHITQPMCAFIRAEKMWEQWVKSRRTPEGKRKFFNFNLGLEYEDGTEAITASLVRSRVVEGTVEVGPIYIGIDQGDISHVVVSKMVNGLRRYIWIGTLSDFNEVERLIIYYNPRICVIDALPNHHNSRMLARKYHNVYVSYYTGSNKLERKYWDKELLNKEVKIPRTDVLDKTASEWHLGNVVIENYIPTYDITEFIEQMTNSKRKYQEDRDGHQKAEWVKVGDDHYRHADTYNWLATEIGRSSYSDNAVISSPYDELSIQENIFSESEVW